eukprot:1160788-Pelagomonas_calceolata.AAC.7
MRLEVSVHCSVNECVPPEGMKCIRGEALRVLDVLALGKGSEGNAWVGGSMHALDMLAARARTHTHTHTHTRAHTHTHTHTCTHVREGANFSLASNHSIPSSRAASMGAAPVGMAVDDVLAGGGAEQYREGPLSSGGKNAVPVGMAVDNVLVGEEQSRSGKGHTEVRQQLDYGREG